jgi:hypothetical protein
LVTVLASALVFRLCGHPIEEAREQRMVDVATHARVRSSRADGSGQLLPRRRRHVAFETARTTRPLPPRNLETIIVRYHNKRYD